MDDDFRCMGRSFLSSVKWNSFSAVFLAIFNMGSSLLVIDYLGLERAGLYALINSIIFIQFTTGGLGLIPASVRTLGINYKKEDYETVRRIAGTTTLVSITVGLIVGLSLWLGGPWILSLAQFKGEIGDALQFCMLMGFVVVIQQTTMNTQSHLKAAMHYEGIAYANNVTSLLRFLGVIGIIRVFPSLTNLGFLYLATALYGLVVSAWYAQKVGCVFSKPKWHPKEGRELFSQGKWIVLTQVYGIATKGADRLIFASFFGAAALPLYNIPKRFSEFAHTILQRTFESIYPYLSRTENENTLETVQQLRWIVGLLAGLFFLGLTAFMPILLPYIVDKGLVITWMPYMFILFIAGVVHAQSIVLYFASFAAAKAQFTGLFSFTGILILVLMAVAGKFGPLACTAAMLGVVLNIPLFFYIYFRNQFHDSSLRTTLGPVGSSTGSFIPFLCVIQLSYFEIPNLLIYSLISMGSLLAYAALNCLIGRVHFYTILARLANRHKSFRKLQRLPGR